MPAILTTKDQQFFASYPVLRAGMRHAKVPLIKAILRSQGAWTGSDSEDFGPKLKAAVQYFQSTHLRSDGAFLSGDGEVGPFTWWSLYNPTGAAQKSNITPVTPTNSRGKLEQEFKRRYGGLPESRQKFLRALWEEYLKDVREIPDGSNAGPDVDRYTDGFGAVYWCALFQSYCFKKAMGFFHKGKRRAGVMDWFNSGVEAGWAFAAKSGYKPKPGDLMAWRFAKGAGHISAVVSLNMAGDKMNTIGGNEGNRVKLGLRNLGNEPQLAGFINLFDDMKTSMSFVPELLAQAELDEIDQRATR